MPARASAGNELSVTITIISISSESAARVTLDSTGASVRWQATPIVARKATSPHTWRALMLVLLSAAQLQTVNIGSPAGGPVQREFFTIEAKNSRAIVGMNRYLLLLLPVLLQDEDSRLVPTIWPLLNLCMRTITTSTSSDSSAFAPAVK